MVGNARYTHRTERSDRFWLAGEHMAYPYFYIDFFVNATHVLRSEYSLIPPLKSETEYRAKSKSPLLELKSDLPLDIPS